MSLIRKQEILKASKEFLKINYQNDLHAFVVGAEWADVNPDISENSKISTLIRVIQRQDEQMVILKQTLDNVKRLK